MADSPRAQLLRTARTRAMARLRAENDEQYQRLMDEEIAKLGGDPRIGTLPYVPRNPQLREQYKQ